MNCFCETTASARLWLYLKRLYFISSAIAYCISPYASFYAGLSCNTSLQNNFAKFGEPAFDDWFTTVSPNADPSIMEKRDKKIIIKEACRIDYAVSLRRRLNIRPQNKSFKTFRFITRYAYHSFYMERFLTGNRIRLKPTVIYT